MAITNGYCTLNDVKSALNLDDAIDNSAIELAISTACRQIDDYCGRFFYIDGIEDSPAIRYYSPTDWWVLPVDDFLSVDEIATDDSYAQTYLNVWQSTDRMFEPVNNPSRGWPLTRILAVGNYYFPRFYPQSVRVTGIFGWSAVP